MTELTLTEKLTNLLVDRFGVKKEEITPMAELGKDLSLDSIEIADLISIVEKDWRVEIPKDTILPKLKTFNDLVAIVEEYTNEF